MSALPDLRGKTAVVTGGASGIGKGIAKQLIAEGMRMVIADIEQDALRQTAEEIGAVVVHAVKRGDLYALTHPDWDGMVEQRHQAVTAAVRAAQAADAAPRQPR